MTKWIFLNFVQSSHQSMDLYSKKFYDPLEHSPQENQQYLITLIEEMRCLRR